MNEQDVVERVRQLYPDATIDIAGEDCSFELYVVSESFKGLGTLQRQKPILALFKDDIKSGAMHALTIKAKTPEELSAGSGGGLVQIQMPGNT